MVCDTHTTVADSRYPSGLVYFMFRFVPDTTHTHRTTPIVCVRHHLIVVCCASDNCGIRFNRSKELTYRLC